MEDWKVQTLTVGPLQMNAYLIWSAATSEAILVDPGAEPETLRSAVVATGCRLQYLLCTHGHFDHVGAATELQQTWDLPLRCHRADEPIIAAMPQVQSAYGFPSSGLPRLAPDLDQGQEIPFAGGGLTVRHVPGHSPGHVMFVLPDVALVGDCIFLGSVGRTDLPGGSFAALAQSIRQEIYTLPDAVRLLPGHGPPTTVGQEKNTNPFVNPRH
jgi:glyoxylase-like metal-dependent hydrolase (beta-lactamase superfamily II)